MANLSPLLIYYVPKLDGYAIPDAFTKEVAKTWCKERGVYYTSSYMVINWVRYFVKSGLIPADEVKICNSAKMPTTFVLLHPDGNFKNPTGNTDGMLFWHGDWMSAFTNLPPPPKPKDPDEVDPDLKYWVAPF